MSVAPLATYCRSAGLGHVGAHALRSPLYAFRRACVCALRRGPWERAPYLYGEALARREKQQT